MSLVQTFTKIGNGLHADCETLLADSHVLYFAELKHSRTIANIETSASQQMKSDSSAWKKVLGIVLPRPLHVQHSDGEGTPLTKEEASDATSLMAVYAEHSANLKTVFDTNNTRWLETMRMERELSKSKVHLCDLWTEMVNVCLKNQLSLDDGDLPTTLQEMSDAKMLHLQDSLERLKSTYARETALTWLVSLGDHVRAAHKAIQPLLDPREKTSRRVEESIKG